MNLGIHIALPRIFIVNVKGVSNVVEFVQKWCARCKASHAEILNAEIAVDMDPGRAGNPINVTNAFGITEALRRNAYASPQGVNPIVIVRSGYDALDGGHANALFFYLKPGEQVIETRLFDPNVEANQSTYHSERVVQTRAALSEFLPKYLAKVLPQWRYEDGNYGETCPIGLQSTDALTKPQVEQMRQITAEQKAAKEAYARATRDLDAHRITFAVWRDASIRYTDALESYGKWYKEQEQAAQLTNPCQREPGGFCESWSALLMLTHVAFPYASVDDIANDIWLHYEQVAPHMRNLIARFGYNLYKREYDPRRRPLKACCYESELNYNGPYYPDDVCQ